MVFPFSRSQKPLIHTVKDCKEKRYTAGWCRNNALYLYAGDHELNIRWGGLLCLPLFLHTNVMTVVSLGHHHFLLISVQVTALSLIPQFHVIQSEMRTA